MGETVMETNRIAEAGAATVATTGTGVWALMEQGHHLLQMLLSVFMVAWWIRLWIRNPAVPPPSTLPGMTKGPKE